MLKKTVLNSAHRALNARMVDFGGWDMPVNYGSQIEEHHAVRNDCGMFDVSHMCPVDVVGADCRPFLSRLVANDVAKLTVSGKALYSAMLNEAGGVIDDLIIYFLTDTRFRIVVNAGTAEKDLAWMQAKAAEWKMDVCITQRRDGANNLGIPDDMDQRLATITGSLMKTIQPDAVIFDFGNPRPVVGLKYKEAVKLHGATRRAVEDALPNALNLATDTDGAIHITSDGSTYTLTTQLSATGSETDEPSLLEIGW